MTDSSPRPRPPVPSSISEEAQRYLATPAPLGEFAAPTDPTDLEAWTTYVAIADERLAGRFPAIDFDALPLRYDRIEIDGSVTYVSTPQQATDSTPIYLDIHGGALIMGGGELCRMMTLRSSLQFGMVSWAVDYRMPPRHPYPTSLDDCVAAYRRALQERDPADLFVGGASAGGNLAAALLVRAKDEGLPMPAGLVLITPEVDLTESGDTFVTNDGIDSVLRPLMTTNLLYANGHDLAHPYLSPLFGDLAGFPPTFLQAGTRDLFLSNTVRMHRRLRAAGVDAELHVWEAMPHGGFGGTSPEDLEVTTEIVRFLDRLRRDR